MTAAELPNEQVGLRSSSRMDAAAVTSAAEASFGATAQAGNIQPGMLPIIPAPPKTAPPGADMRPSSQGGPPAPSPPPTGSSRGRSSHDENGAPTSRAAMGRALRKSVIAANFAKAGKSGAGHLMVGTPEANMTPAQLMQRMEAATPGFDRTVRTERGSEVQVSAEDQFRLGLQERQQQGGGGGLNSNGLPLPKFEAPLEKVCHSLRVRTPVSAHVLSLLVRARSPASAHVLSLSSASRVCRLCRRRCRPCRRICRRGNARRWSRRCSSARSSSTGFLRTRSVLISHHLPPSMPFSHLRWLFEDQVPWRICLPLTSSRELSVSYPPAEPTHRLSPTISHLPCPSHTFHALLTPVLRLSPPVVSPTPGQEAVRRDAPRGK